ncbi:MAG: tRNA glutamyl-Q(34) synthetase GluQRS [Verrucomicrobiota bacterium]
MASGGPPVYRGRIAPSPTGHLHLGHARTFWIAHGRAESHGGVLVLRNEDLDGDRVRREFVEAFFEDLRWFGIRWQEGPDCGGPHGPYSQSERRAVHQEAFERLRAAGQVYPCVCSRKDIQAAVRAPHAADDEPLYPGTCRCRPVDAVLAGRPVSWRFRVPDGEVLTWNDGGQGSQARIAGRDFGDFVVVRPDGVPSYQLACVVDDHAMGITEVVRGADLLVSTARQILLYRALGWAPPAFFHCPLLTDAQGVRLSKRHAALSLRTLRDTGAHPSELRAAW